MSPPERPSRLVVVAGTATEVGKTWVAAGAARALRAAGLAVAARKPAQSFEHTDATTDADVLAAATGERPEAVTPRHRWYPVPMAPPMAAAALGREPATLADLAAELAWPPGTAIGLVETAGGVRSPLAADGDTVDLCRLVAADLAVLVADAGLGTINAVRLGAGALGGGGGVPVVVHLNRFDAGDDLHRRNLAWLRDRDGFDVTTTLSELVDRLRVHRSA